MIQWLAKHWNSTMARLSQTGYFVSMIFIFLIISPDCVVGGSLTRLLHNLHEESGVGAVHIMPSDQPSSELSGLRIASGHRTTDHPGYNSLRKLLARRRPTEATESGKPTSENGVEGQASTSAPAASSSRRRFPFHTHFAASKFPFFFTMAKSSSTVSPSPGTPSPGHN